MTINFENLIKKSGLYMVIIAVIIYALFFLMSDFSKSLDILKNITFIYIPLILLLRFSTLLIKSIRQFFLLRTLGIPITFRDSLIVYLAGLSMMLTPGGAGSLIKSYLFKKIHNFDYSKTMAVVIQEKFHDIFGPVIVVTILLTFIEFDEIRIIIVILLFLLLFFIFPKSKKISSKLVSILSKIKLFKKFDYSIDQFYKHYSLLLNKRNFVFLTSLSVLATLVDGVAIFFAFLSLGIDLNYFESIVAVYVPNIIGLISFIPGGIGVTEGGMLTTLIKFGVPIASASAAVLFVRLTGIWFYILLGIIAKIYLLKIK